jgi:hypothetical protein
LVDFFLSLFTLYFPALFSGFFSMDTVTPPHQLSLLSFLAGHNLKLSRLAIACNIDHQQRPTPSLCMISMDDAEY